MGSGWTRGARFRLRAAESADYPTFVRFFAELGVDDPVVPPERWAAGDCQRTSFLLDGDGLIVGYALTQLYGEVAHLRHLVVAPACRGRGVGRALMSASGARLRKEGALRWRLNVKRDNLPALRLYARMGLKEAYRSTAFRVPWSAIDRLAVPADPPVIEEVPAERNAELEASFDLDPGRLTCPASATGQVVLQALELRPARKVVGLARFDPALPGAYPFRAAREGTVAALLGELRRRAGPGDASVDLLVEGEAEADSALRRAGAHVRFEIVHLRGELADALA